MVTHPSPQITFGIDFTSAVWAPVRGTVAGFNPYRTGDAGYLDATGQAVSASLHAPSLLLTASPLATLDAHAAAVVWAAATAAMLWAAAWILMRPNDIRSATATVTLGLALTLAGPGDYLLRLGQVTGLVILGFAMLVRWPRSWAGAVGVALMLVSPQIGVPMSILAMGAHQSRTVWRGWALTAVLSLPVMITATVAAGGLGQFLESVVANLAKAADDENARNRIDAAGVWGGGVGMDAALLLLVVAVAVWWRRSRRPVDEVAVLGAAALTLLAAFSMPYSLGVVLAAAWPVLWARHRWGAVEWCAVVLVVVCAAQSLPLLVAVNAVTGWSVLGVWRLLALLEHLVLVALLVSVTWRLTRNPVRDAEGRVAARAES
jgi:hypothetical protein